MKKIALVSDAVYPFNKGGKEKRLHGIATRLAAAGNEVTIYCMKWWKGPKSIMQDGVHLYAISPYYPLYNNGHRSIKQGLLFAWHCLGLVSKDFDVLDVDHIPHLVIFSTKIVSLIKRRELIVTWHEVWGRKYWQSYLGAFKGYLAYLVEKISVLLPNKIISVSSRTTVALREVLGVSRNVFTVPNGIEQELITNAIPSTTQSDVIFAGRLLTHKNVDVLLHSIAVIKKTNPAIKVIIVGDGPEKGALEKITEELGLQTNVSFVGFLEKETDLYRLLRASKVFVLPSTREGFGLAVVEANAAGLPVVTVDIPTNASRDLIIHNENGMLCDLDPRALANTIISTLQSRKDASFYTHYSEQYSIEKCINTIMNIYNNGESMKNVGPRKIVVVASYFYPKVGGLETIAYTTAKMLQDSGEYAVSIISSNYDGKGYRKDTVNGMTIHRLPITFRLSNTPINLRWAKMIGKIFDEEKPDLVHTHSPVPFMADVAAAVAHKRKIPLVVTYHSGSMRKGSFILDLIIGVYESYFLKKLFQRANAIVAVAKNFVPVVFPQFVDKTFFISTGVDLARFKATPVPVEEKVAFVGRIELSSQWKGIEYLIKAMSLVIKKRPQATVTLIGGGDALALYRRQAETLGISDHLFTPGPQYNSDLIKAYQDMSMMVLPSTSDSEAFSVSLVEAMASGRPVIGTNIGGTPQVIEDEKTGLIVPPKNPEALAAAIERVLSDHVFAQQLGDSGALKAQDFSWEIQTDKYKEVFKKILQGSI